VAGDIVGLIGRAALPIGLLAVGAALQLESIPGHLQAVSAASMVQFGLKPVVVASLITFFGLSGVPAGVLLLTFATPVAPSSYILSRQLGGDTATMASIITLQTLLAFIVMPIVALVML
jgi:predicted permease